MIQFAKKVFYANGGAFLEIPKDQIIKEETGPAFQEEIFHNSVKILLNHKRNYKLSEPNKTVLKANKENITHENINYL